MQSALYVFIGNFTLLLQTTFDYGFFSQWFYVLMFFGVAAVAYFLGKKQGRYSSAGRQQVTHDPVQEAAPAIEQLSAQENLFGLFVKYTPAGVAMVDKEMRYIAVSDRWYQDYGITEDIIGKTHYEVFPQILEMPEWLAIHKKCLQGEIAKSEKDLMLDENGNEVWLRWEIHPWRNNKNEIGGIIMFTETITDRVKAEHEVRDKKELLQLVIDNMNDGLVVIGEHDKVEILNIPKSENFSTIDNIDLNSDFHHLMYGNTLYDKDGVTVLSEDEHPLKKAQHGDVFSNYITQIKTGEHGKAIYFSNSGAPLKDIQGNIKGVVLVFRDVTQQFELQKRTEQINLELEEKVKKRTAELEAINKEMESFSYSVSHDLRAPLRAITGFSRILASEYQEKLGEEGQRYLQMIIDNSNNMGQLIDDLLEFSKLGRKDLKVEKLNMTQTVKSIWAEQISLLSENSAELELDEMPDVIADGAMLRQVWVNLISNALKFSSRQDKPLIKIGAQENGNAITYHIQDNGVGFDMKYYKKLFGVFQRLHSSADFEGTGVGLALSHRIINRHGGQIWAESAPNVGTTFYFTIPINHGTSS